MYRPILLFVIEVNMLFVRCEGARWGVRHSLTSCAPYPWEAKFYPMHFKCCPLCDLRNKVESVSQFNWTNSCDMCLTPYVYDSINGGWRCVSCSRWQKEVTFSFSCNRCKTLFPSLYDCYSFCPLCGFAGSSTKRNNCKDAFSELCQLEDKLQFPRIQRLALEILTSVNQEFEPDDYALKLHQRLPVLLRKRLKLSEGFSFSTIIRDRCLDRSYWNDWGKCGLIESFIYALMLYDTKIETKGPYNLISPMLNGMAREQLAIIASEHREFVLAHPEVSPQKQAEAIELKSKVVTMRLKALEIVSSQMDKISVELAQLEQSSVPTEIKDEEAARLLLQQSQFQGQFLKLQSELDS